MIGYNEAKRWSNSEEFGKGSIEGIAGSKLQFSDRWCHGAYLGSWNTRKSYCSCDSSWLDGPWSSTRANHVYRAIYFRFCHFLVDAGQRRVFLCGLVWRTHLCTGHFDPIDNSMAHGLSLSMVGAYALDQSVVRCLDCPHLWCDRLPDEEV